MFGKIKGLMCCLAAGAAVLAGGAAATAQTPIGVCCLSGFYCTIGNRDACTGGGGVYQGDNTTCAPTNPCRLLIGACCVVKVHQQFPATQPLATTKVPNTDSRGIPTGADANQLYECVISTSAGCTLRSGTYQGNDSTCSPTSPCPQPAPTMGACCSLSTTNTPACRMDTAEGCAATNATFTAAGTACAAATCAQPTLGACCRTQSGYVFCSITSEAACTANGSVGATPGGTFMGSASACGATTCPQPVLGTCCTAATATQGSFCAVGYSNACAASGQVFSSTVTTCAAATTCVRSCACDYDRNGFLTVYDFTLFWNDWLAGHADYNNSGATDMADYTDFLNCYLWTSSTCIRR